MTESEQTRTGSAVVIGVDGSDGAKEALRWALAEARLRKAPLRIIHAWTYAYLGAATGGYGYLGGFDSSSAIGVESGELQREAEELVDHLIAEVAGDVNDVESTDWSSTETRPRCSSAPRARATSWSSGHADMGVSRASC